MLLHVKSILIHTVSIAYDNISLLLLYILFVCVIDCMQYRFLMWDCMESISNC